MAKTSCRSLRSTIIKKEECEDELKQKKEILHSTNTATKTINKITKNKNSIQIQVKAENVDDSKVLLASPKKKISLKSKITAEQIEKLIGYVVNDKMNMKAAARKVGMAQKTAQRYYRDYQDDPEHKIPLPKTGYSKQPLITTQKKKNDLINYISNDRMNLSQASKKADINRNIAAKYYAKYLEDPDRKIPLLNIPTGSSSKRYTKKDITDLIGYIVNDNMSLTSASIKVNMPLSTTKRYYLKYLQDPNHEIPYPCESNSRSGRHCTNNQVHSLIGYIVSDGMTLLEASIRAYMSESAARKYYQQYLEDPEKNIPTPENNNSRVSNSQPTIDQVKAFFCYIIIDELSVPQAVRKAKIPNYLCHKYYTEYLKNPTQEVEIKDIAYSAEKMKRFVELVQNEKMSLTKAADAAHLNIITARKHYQQYLKKPQYEFPSNKNKYYTQEDIRRLIDYIKHNKMDIILAARKIKMSLTSARRYCNEYLNDSEHRIPPPKIRQYKIKSEKYDKYAQIVADIYKSNPSINPIHENCLSELDTLASEIKSEPVGEDTKMLLYPETN